MPVTVKIERAGVKRYFHRPTGIFIEWCKADGSAGYWTLYERRPGPARDNWLTTTPTLREARQYVASIPVQPTAHGQGRSPDGAARSYYF